MKPTLLILAAGIGSRYGGLKQVDGVGPSGEAVLDYSIYDAIKAGFGKIVFVIRKDIYNDIKEVFIDKWKDQIEIEYVFQELNALPDNYSVPEGRIKPWGTAHAIWVAKDKIKEPFCVINADDFYGANSYNLASVFLSDMDSLLDGKYCLVAYILKNTLSEFGYVSRAECSIDEENNLESVIERLKIKREGDKVIYHAEDGRLVNIDENTAVSMNMWGFMPSLFNHLDDHLNEFLKENASSLKAEFLLPNVIDYLIKNNIIQLPVLKSNEKWFGMTYPEDRPDVQARLNQLVKDGRYPSPIWEK